MPDRLTDEQIAAMLTLVDGPWSWRGSGFSGAILGDIVDAHGGVVARIVKIEGFERQLMVAAPDLLAEVAELRAEVRRLRGEVGDAR